MLYVSAIIAALLALMIVVIAVYLRRISDQLTVGVARI